MPIFIDADFNVIDGGRRAKGAAALKWKSVPVRVCTDLSYEQKRQLALDLNLHRRQVSKEQVEALAVRLRQDGFSYREIGLQLGISHETARKYIENATVNNLTLNLPKQVKGRDGKIRQAKVERKRHPSIDARNLTEAHKIVETCKSIGVGQLPAKTINLKHLARLERTQRAAQRRKEQYTDLSLGTSTLLLGDFRERGQEIASDSIDMIFTDPPYDKDSLSLWNDLGQLAKRVLKPGGMLLSYSGIMYLPTVHQILGQHLDYLWTFAIHHTGGGNILTWLSLRQEWKPVLSYYKPPLRKHWNMFADMVSGGKNKDNHPWEQAESEAQHYIKALCPPNGTLLDPMMGSGTTLVAAHNLNMGIQATGIEIDGAAYGTAQDRVKQAQDKGAGVDIARETA